MTTRVLDSFDRRILMELQRQGDIGPVELSERLHLSPSQCSRRIQRLKEEGYVAETVARLDRERLQIGVTAYVLITLKSHAPHRMDNFLKLVRTTPEILECASTTGEADFVLKICTHDLPSYNRFLSERILMSDEIETARSNIVLQQFKDTTALSLEFLSAG